jgi:4-hydroxythreonine-4-phosphate dehydrogenase
LSPLRIAITPGEPAGVGPDLAAHLSRGWPEAELVLVADPALLRDRAGLGRTTPLPRHTPERAGAAPVPGRVSVLQVPLPAPVVPGHPDPANAGYVLDSLRLAVRGCLDGTFQALVTGPVHKGIINQAGQPFTGHTEFLAALTGSHPVMLLAAPGLRVALATTHLPLAQVPRQLTPATLERVLRILHQDLIRRFGLPRPRILVCGLNPHAGEGGHLGREELDIIIPVLTRLRDAGLDLRGPLPADTLFTPPQLAGADAVLAMYHDQGLPVLKHLGFGRAVNVTLGLPIVRTSVDHGTALELAGSDRADPGSLFAALELAVALARRERQAAPAQAPAALSGTVDSSSSAASGR